MDELFNEKTWLLIIRSSNADFNEYILTAGYNYLGREEDNDCVLYDNAASNRHADIYYDQAANTATIRDLESTNGTFINGKRINKPQTLQPEDQIRIGHCLIAVSITAQCSAAERMG